MTDFPDRIYVSLVETLGDETLEAAFAPEDLEADEVAVYELKSVGRVERTARFVENDQHTVEQRRNARCESFHKAGQ